VYYTISSLPLTDTLISLGLGGVDLVGLVGLVVLVRVPGVRALLGSGSLVSLSSRAGACLGLGGCR
jgi:hypothetical protein